MVGHREEVEARLLGHRPELHELAGPNSSLDSVYPQVVMG